MPDKQNNHAARYADTPVDKTMDPEREEKPASGFSGRFDWNTVTVQEDAPQYAPDPEEEAVRTAGSSGSGIPLRAASLGFAVTAVLLSIALFLVNGLVSSGYQRSEEADNRYLSAIQAAAELEAGSDWLTDRVRCYAETGEREYLDDFFREVHVTRRRDRALEKLDELLEGNAGEAYASLSAALGYSNELMEREYLAIRLTAEALGADEAELPDEVAGLVPGEEYASLSPSEKREAARSLVFDGEYMRYKDLIRENVGLCTETLIRETSDFALEAAAHLNRMRGVQTALIAVFLCAVLVAVIFIHSRVTEPLTRMVRLMREERMVPSRGVSELRFVTETYNDILEDNRQVRQHLTYEASHDALTGLYNRSAYEMFTQSIDQDHIALLLADVDKFKEYNDTWGHDVGDRVLVRVAETLKQNFRSVDIICRIGGDEFVVIMRRMDSSMAELVKEKVKRVNDLLQNPTDGMPKISLSVGVAFSDRPAPEGDIFKDADTALYRVKNGGRCGCAVFE